jgi:hypothetical protein
MREQLLSAFDIVRKPAAGRHHAVLRTNEYCLALARHERARDAVVLGDQLPHR